ncbi:ABC transporter ATP-binding protein [Alicyclobacillus shizuokensis]|uniref:ABC transporter ATP-binding protein n=1 Tax=Alicyclobacillus shizuokensis TaxID=392014 RepID=UPI00082FC7C3|nr:DUF3744 domain-containing protein [Alicyclobacillus shizuokensis]
MALRDRQQPVISLHGVTFTYAGLADPSLRDVSLEIRAGQRVLIVGPSGSGKSTLARCINGLIPHSFRGRLSGTIRVAGKDTSRARISEIADCVGTVLQDPESQFVGLTVAEDVAFALENQAMPLHEMKKRVQEALDVVRMWPHREQSPHHLSGGQKQKTALAGVLAMLPDILLFDEPLANLDPESGRQMMLLIDELNRRSGKTVVIIEHRLEDVLAMDMDRIILIDDGRIQADLSVAEMLVSGRLEKAGIRLPLYLEALERMGATYDAESVPVTVNQVPRDGTVQRAVQWATHPRKEEDLNRGAPVPSPKPPVVEVRDLGFAYPGGHAALDNVSFSVYPGERVSLLGHNGAGKSTLCHLLLGILKPRHGSVRIHGKKTDGWSVTEHGRAIGYVMQNPHHMLSQDKVFDEVAFGPRNWGLAEAEVVQRVEEALRICDLAGYRHWPIHALSFGQKKRLTIAAALALRPSMLILDEPTAGQDYRHAREIMNFISRLAKAGIAMLVVTHDMQLALEYTDRALVLAHGRLRGDGPVSKVFSDQSLLMEAGLQVTSLYRLAERLGMADEAESLIRRFIEREEASGETA